MPANSRYSVGTMRVALVLGLACMLLGVSIVASLDRHRQLHHELCQLAVSLTGNRDVLSQLHCPIPPESLRK